MYTWSTHPWLTASVPSWLGAWLAAERGRFVLFVPVLLAAGALAYFDLGVEPSLWPPVALAAFCGAAGWLTRRRPIILAVFIGAGALAVGFACARGAASRAAPWDALPRHAAVLEGLVTAVEFLPAGRRVTVAALTVDGVPAARALRVRLRNADVTDIAPGDHVRVRALVRAPPAPAYPGAWDMQRDAFFVGMAGYGFAIGPIEVVAQHADNWLQRLRTVIARRALAALPGPRGAIAATLLTGQGSAVPSEVRQDFAVSGLAHLLAVAGLHVGIVMGLVFGAVRALLCLSEYAMLHFPVREIATLAALAAAFGYLLLSGGHVPIWRSFAMGCLMALAVLTGRRAVSMRALAIAATGLILVAPWEILGVSLQMSFAAVLALVAGWEVLRPRLAPAGAGKWWGGVFHAVAGLVITSALAGTACLPFAAYHFGSAALFYVPANVIAVPLTALWVMPWGLAALLLMPFGLDHFAFVPMGWGIGVLSAIAHAVARWPGAVTRLPQMPGAGLACLAVGMAWLGIWRTRLRLLGLAPIVAGLAGTALVTPPDAIVSADAALIAVRSGGRVMVEESVRAGPFDAETPLRLWGEVAVGAQFACAQAACDVARPGGVIRLIRQGPPVCTGVDLLVSASPLHGACPTTVTVDRQLVARDGAAAIWLTGGRPFVLTDRVWRGVRPWVIGAAERPPLPPALTE